MAKVQLNINSKALVAHIDRVVWRQPSDDLSYLATVNMVCRSQKYFWSPSSTSTWRLMKWRHHDVIDVEVHSWSWRWTPKNNLRPEMNKQEDSMIYDHLIVFIRHGPVEIRRFRCQHALLKIWPAPVFSCLCFMNFNVLLAALLRNQEWFWSK